MHIAPSPEGDGSGPGQWRQPATEPAAVRDWLRVQQALRLAERELAAVSERYARGAASGEELDAASKKAIALRELSLAVLYRLRHA
jgi:hypothetical protein